MKKRTSAIPVFVLIVGMVLFLSGCGENAPAKEEISQLVADAIISDNADMYYESECCGEGHIILGSSLSGGQLKVYALTMFGNYGFQNDMFIKVSGSGVIPAVLTFEKDGSEYRLLEIEYPKDGSEYVKSIKRMFPLRYRAAAMHCDGAYDELISQERKYAEVYLQNIGRNAEIGEYRDLNAVLLTDLGVSVEVSNQLACDKNLGDYPLRVGTTEYIKDGVRYIRSVSFDELTNQIIYKTVEKERRMVVETFIFDAATGTDITDSVRNQTSPANDNAGTPLEEAPSAALPNEQNLTVSVPPPLTLYETASAFTGAYFSQDVNIIRSFLSSDFAGDPKDVCPWSGIEMFTVKGTDDETIDRADGEKIVSVEFRDPDYPDSFVYLTIGLVKENDEWRVRWYGLEK